MPSPAGPLARIGRGRWSAIMRPSIGTLWVTDTGEIGFHADHGMIADAVNTLIANALDAGKDANTAFDELHAAIGGPVVHVGTLDHWTEDRSRLVIPRGDLE